MLDGTDRMQLWYDQQIPSVQAELTNIVMYLRDQPIEDWGSP